MDARRVSRPPGDEEEVTGSLRSDVSAAVSAGSNHTLFEAKHDART
jgi:hypothetical protein